MKNETAVLWVAPKGNAPGFGRSVILPTLGFFSIEIAAKLITATIQRETAVFTLHYLAWAIFIPLIIATLVWIVRMSRHRETNLAVMPNSMILAGQPKPAAEPSALLPSKSALRTKGIGGQWQGAFDYDFSRKISQTGTNAGTPATEFAFTLELEERLNGGFEGICKDKDLGDVYGLTTVKGRAGDGQISFIKEFRSFPWSLIETPVLYIGGYNDSEQSYSGTWKKGSIAGSWHMKR
jgi:hypothetical protein